MNLIKKWFYLIEKKYLTLSKPSGKGIAKINMEKGIDLTKSTYNEIFKELLDELNDIFNEIKEYDNIKVIEITSFHLSRDSLRKDIKKIAEKYGVVNERKESYCRKFCENIAYKSLELKNKFLFEKLKIGKIAKKYKKNLYTIRVELDRGRK